MLMLLALPGLITMIVYVLIFVIVVSLIYYLVNTFLPEPMKKYAIAIVVVVAVIFLLIFLLQIVGSGELKM
jgi:hypothetical protein